MFKANKKRGATSRTVEQTDGVPAFRRRHLVLASAAALGLSAIVSLSSGDSSPAVVPEPLADAAQQGSPAADDKRKVIPLQIALPETLVPDTTAAIAVEPIETWQDFEIRNGDSLSIVFQRAGLDDGDVYHIVNKAEGGKSLTRIFPGQSLGFQLSEEGELQALRYQKSRLESVIYRRQGGSYDVEQITQTPERHRSFASATIKSSLFMAGDDAGMTQNTIMELANIFGGVIDFVLDPRTGDHFHVLYEELWFEGEKLRDGEILAAEFVNRGKRYTAYRYVDANGKVGYFSEDGVSMRKAFMLAPVDFTRVSSNFNLKRLHPIYKTTRPHRGTDYAAPRGTPVFAAGDGKVTAAGYTKANGNYIVIQHGQAYTTKYLHLHKRSVKKGSRVTQQQVIGTVGSTGAATGPHLHYEFLMNGVHRNPRTIHKKLPKAVSLASAEMSRFEDQTRSLTMQLASIRQTQLASNSGQSGPSNSL
ncbi:peptidase M23 [Halieaceae bacterium IMCC14734]|uniref:Peptidase M23 n=1 Tax=Candidatus Litorirhabdus singularis TaxID=2518993 RepID=A0ABT3TLW0_9GAMM|nr:peptidoglycan DD-metalloendopeptidase family protein [Candidatus Litorirhabdus singularis]MCX2983317.1 peptidase M23 [Candidatus Litorirhabdus singularis]